MLKLIVSYVKGLITQFKRRNFDRHYLAGNCVRMFIFRESQKIWINPDGSYVLLPKWYIEKEVRENV